MESYTIILVTYNRAFRIKKVIEALLKQTVPARKIIIVDNHSDDSTGEIIREFNNQLIQYLDSGSNVGHGAGLAFGFDWYIKNEFSEEWILLAEDDSECSSSWADSMIRRIMETTYSILVLDGLIHKVGKRFTPAIKDNEIVEVDFGLLDGAVVKSTLIKEVGLPVSDWFMMCDDMEYSTRIIQAGYKIGCVKNHYHTILHLGGTAKASTTTKIWRAYYQSRNHVHYLRRYFSLKKLLDFSLIESKRLLGSVFLERNFSKSKYRLIGIYHGLRGIKGRSLNPKTLTFDQ